MMMVKSHDISLLRLICVRMNVILLTFNIEGSTHHEITLFHLGDGSLHNPHRIAYCVSFKVILDLFQTILITHHGNAYPITLKIELYAFLSRLWNF